MNAKNRPRPKDDSTPLFCNLHSVTRMQIRVALQNSATLLSRILPPLTKCRATTLQQESIRILLGDSHTICILTAVSTRSRILLWAIAKSTDAQLLGLPQPSSLKRFVCVFFSLLTSAICNLQSAMSASSPPPRLAAAPRPPPRRRRRRRPRRILAASPPSHRLLLATAVSSASRRRLLAASPPPHRLHEIPVFLNTFPCVGPCPPRARYVYCLYLSQFVGSRLRRSLSLACSPVNL